MINLLRNWPTSLPDYQWPPMLTLPRHAAGRVMLAALFHLGYAVGLIAGALLCWRRRPAAVVIRTDGIGDAILFEPAMESLARSLSPHELHLWAPAATCELMRACPFLRHRVAIPRGLEEGNLLVLRSPVWRVRLGLLLGFHRYEVAIYPAESPEPLGNWLLLSIRAAIHWVNYGDTINQSERQRSATHARVTRVLSNRPGAAHELVRNAYLSSQWGGSLELRRPKLPFTAKTLAQADAQAAAWRHAERQWRASGTIALIPAGAETINRYPAQKWIAVIQELWREHRMLCAILGAKAEEEFIAQITSPLGEVPFLRPDRALDTATTAALVGRLDGLISVDTGLAHAAIAQEVPSVILRLGGDPGRFFPWPGETKCAVLFQAMPCEGCHNHCHLGEAKCITDVAPEEIVAACAKLSAHRALVQYTPRPARWLKVAG